MSDFGVKFLREFTITTGPSSHAWSCNHGCGPFANRVEKDGSGNIVFEQYCPHEQAERQQAEISLPTPTDGAHNSGTDK